MENTNNINSTKSRQPLTIEEYERDLRLSASDLDLVERTFRTGLDSDQLRSVLWPYLFGLVKHRGRFARRASPAKNGHNHHRQQQNCHEFIYIENEHNIERWRELSKLYKTYENQWKSIQPDQELRFSTFRERKSLIERDVIRSDRTHPFYSASSANYAENLSNLTRVLMTYMMYDFDIGYLQGMSDLAAPILYVFQGDTVKTFWVFVEVMKLFRRNFEFSQKTIHFQLNCLFRLIKLTDAKLANYLRDADCSNCFFVFRHIVCQFKRELMRASSDSQPSSPGESSTSSNDEDSVSSSANNFKTQANKRDDYANVLNLWDTIWSVQRRHELRSKSKFVHTFKIATSNGVKREQRVVYTKETFYSSFDPNQADIPRFELTETEKFVISLCLSLIRRERNYILQKRLDASEIHQHFIRPRLASDLDQFLANAYEIYHYLNHECDLQSLVKGASEFANPNELSPIKANVQSNGINGCGLPSPSANGTPDELACSSAADTYDLLKDYFIISPTAYNISLNSLNNSTNGGPPDLSCGGAAGFETRASPLSIHHHHHHQKGRQKASNGSHRSWDHFVSSTPAVRNNNH